MIPKDPNILLSFVNLKLRDYYSSLDIMCEDMELDKQVISEQLSTINYNYNAVKNQFV